MIRMKQIKCPHCGFENKVSMDLDKIWREPQRETCDVDEGGCDQDYYLDAEVEVKPIILKLVEAR